MNKLYFGDNLVVLREHIADESIDLVYLDPPFNSNKNYNILFNSPKGQKSEAQITAFEDTWHWGDEAEREYTEILHQPNTDVAEMIQAFRKFLVNSDMMAYLTMMTIRLLELHRVLKPTGSLYLHCDPTASHYLKVLLDMVFGAENFRNEIIWKRTSSHSDANRCGNVHDTLLFYSKQGNHTWNKTYQTYDLDYVDKYYRYSDPDGRKFMSADLTGGGDGPPRFFGDRGQLAPQKGRHWMYDQSGIDKALKENRIYWTKNGIPRLKKYIDEASGMPLQDIWTDVQALRSWHQELLGYPTLAARRMILLTHFSWNSFKWRSESVSAVSMISRKAIFTVVIFSRQM